MKIGIDCHNLEGQRTGVGRYLRNLLREWENVTGSDPVTLEFFLYFKSEVPPDVHNKAWNVRNLRVKSNALFKHWFLPRAARRDKVDVLFCPDYVLPLLLVLAKMYTNKTRSRFICIKTAVSIHDVIYEARPEQYSWPSFADRILLKWASKQSAKKADLIFAPSEFTKSEIVEYYKINPEKVVVTPLAPDPIFRHYPRPACPAYRQAGRQAGIAEDMAQKNKYIFFVGSIFNRRFLPQAIQAFREFGTRYKNFQFQIVGKNHTKPYQDIGGLVEGTNKKLGREAVIWREYASDEELVYLYNGAYATLWLSSYEGFGLPILESMACGTPVVTSPKGSLPEVARDAAMYVVHPESPEEISNALTHLARYDSYRNELITKGLARAAQFSWQKCAKQTIDNILRLE